MAEPVLDGSPLTNIAEEHVYKPVVTFGSSTVSTSRGVKELVITRPTSTTLVLTFSKPYAEITSYHVGRKAAAGVAGLEWIITTNNITTTGAVTLTSIESDTGAATAPASGDVAYISIGVSVNALNDLYTSATA